MASTDYLDRAVLNHVFRGVPMSAPTAVYVGLFTSHPDSGKEVAGAGYARSRVTFTEPTIHDGAGTYRISNSDDVLFPKAKGSWGRLTHFAIFDAQAGGNALTPGVIGKPRLIETDDVYRFPKGELKLDSREARTTG